MAVEPALYPCIEGSTDSEVMFYLALTFGLEDDPIGALERMAGFVEAAGHRIDVAEPLQMTVGLSDGERVYAVRYASGAGGQHAVRELVGAGRAAAAARGGALPALLRRGTGGGVRAADRPARAVARDPGRRRR